MALLGKIDPSHAPKLGLDPTALVRLVRDILFTRGHADIRTTDGPGDGGRDVHSLTSERGRHLTQSKFHQNTGVACSSAELSELPIAMVKLGYAHGLFVTNARISPQGKREFLDNYRQLKLEFIDGETLVSEILSHAALRALWFDGAAVGSVNTCLVFPVLIRRHTDDQSDLLNATRWQGMVRYLKQRFPKHSFLIRAAETGIESFANYRAPEPLTLREATSTLRALEVVVGNQPSLADVPRLRLAVCCAITETLNTRVSGYTVKTGRAYMIPLGGLEAGARVTSSTAETVLVTTKFASGSEEDWFSIADSVHWQHETDARMSEAEFIRLYNPTLDCALACEIHCRNSFQSNLLSVANRESMEHGWRQSVFFLIPKWDGVWPYQDIPEPDEQIVWPWNNTLLCCWLHWSLLDSMLPATWPAEKPGEHFEQKRFGTIREAAAKHPQLTPVLSEKARHMVALVGRDPFPESDYGWFCTGEVAVVLNTVPSPIRPRARRFTLTIAWDTEIATKVVSTVCEKMADRSQFSILRNIRVELRGGAILLTADCFDDTFEDLPSSVVLDTIHDVLKDFLPALNADPAIAGRLKHATREYWGKAYGVTLGIKPEESSKAYLWTFGDNGEMLPMKTKEFLDSRSLIRETEARAIDPAINRILNARRGPPDAAPPREKAFRALHKRIGKLRSTPRGSNAATPNEFLVRAVAVCMGAEDMLVDCAMNIGPPCISDPQARARYGSLIDDLATSIQAFAEANTVEALKHVIGKTITKVYEFYGVHLGAANEIIDAATWEEAAILEINKNSSDFHAAFAYAGFHVMRALALVTMAILPGAPQTGSEAIRRANEHVAKHFEKITTVFKACQSRKVRGRLDPPEASSNSGLA